MTVFATVRSGAQAAIDEIVANAAVRQRFPTFVISQAADLNVYAADKAHVKGELQALLRLGSPDPAAVYRGLLIQLNGVFEGFIKSLVSKHVSQIASGVDRFCELNPSLQMTYAARAAGALAKIFDGAINGVRYDFNALQEEMGKCFSGISPFAINGDVFTLLMGNCTPDRLEKLFHQLALPKPFGDEVGQHKAVQSWSGERRANRAVAQAKEELKRQISTRNDLVHGFASKDIVLQDVVDAGLFFGCLVEAYTDLAARLHPAPAP